MRFHTSILKTTSKLVDLALNRSFRKIINQKNAKHRAIIKNISLLSVTGINTCRSSKYLVCDAIRLRKNTYGKGKSTIYLHKCIHINL